ncbi:MAG: orotate phosphoribosyltransferase [Actinomycetota bacterium]
MSPEEALRLLGDSGAMLSGHFLLSSGRHSDRYVEKARVFEDPDTVMALGREMASWYRDVDVVVAPAVGAIVLGFAVAAAGGARFVFAEREGEGDRMTLRRGFELRPGERALVVEDVITTGASAREVHELVESSGAVSLGVAALADRSQTAPPFPLRSVIRVEAVSWDPDECPLCRQGVEVRSTGSRRLPAGA